MKEVSIEVNENVLVLYNILYDMYFKGKYPPEVEKKVLELLFLSEKILKKDNKYEGYNITNCSIIRIIKLEKDTICNM